MIKREIFGITIGMTGGYPIDGKPKEKSEKMHPGIWKRWLVFSIAVIAIIGIMAAVFMGSTPTSTSPSIEAPPINGQQPVIGSSNPSQVNAGQETTDGEWYAIGESIKFNLMNKYGIMVNVKPWEDGSIAASEPDFSVLFNKNKYLAIKMKFRVNSENKIYQTDEMPLGPYTGLTIGNWKHIVGKSVDPNDIKWQIEFAVKDIPVKAKQKEVIVR